MAFLRSVLAVAVAGCASSTSSTRPPCDSEAACTSAFKDSQREFAACNGADCGRAQQHQDDALARLGHYRGQRDADERAEGARKAETNEAAVREGAATTDRHRVAVKAWTEQAERSCVDAWDVSVCEAPADGVEDADRGECRHFCRTKVGILLEAAVRSGRDRCVQGLLAAGGQGKAACTFDVPAPVRAAADDRAETCAASCARYTSETLRLRQGGGY